MFDSNRSQTKHLRFFLRDFRMVEARVAVAEGQSLSSCLAHRKSYINLQDAHWSSTGERVEHAVLKIEQVLWAAALDPDLPLVNAALATPRAVDLQLDGGLQLRAGLNTGERQRLGDYLESAGAFIALRNAILLRSGRPPRKANVVLGDVVVNQAAIQAVWEVASNPGEFAPRDFNDGDPFTGIPDLDAQHVE
ncbi:MAG: hypothetical protein ACRELX_13045 [Longimicrobiales bacterium]